MKYSVLRAWFLFFVFLNIFIVRYRILFFLRLLILCLKCVLCMHACMMLVCALSPPDYSVTFCSAFWVLGGHFPQIFGGFDWSCKH